jgi:hypothetical protein
MSVSGVALTALIISQAYLPSNMHYLLPNTGQKPVRGVFAGKTISGKVAFRYSCFFSQNI